MSESRRHLADAQRIVVQLGTHGVTDDGGEVALARLTHLIDGVVPVLNENDSVSVRELMEHRRAQEAAVAAPSPTPTVGFGDNDGLSARVAVSLDADLLVLLTNVAGLFTANPKHDPTATRISE